MRKQSVTGEVISLRWLSLIAAVVGPDPRFPWISAKNSFCFTKLSAFSTWPFSYCVPSGYGWRLAVSRNRRSAHTGEDSGHHPSPEGLTAVLCGLGSRPGQRVSQARISHSLRCAHGNCITVSLFLEFNEFWQFAHQVLSFWRLNDQRS